MERVLGILCFPLVLILFFWFGVSSPAQFVWGFVGATWIIVFIYAFFAGEDRIAPLHHLLAESIWDADELPGWFLGFAFVGFWGGVVVCIIAMGMSILEWRPTSSDPGVQAYYDYANGSFDTGVAYLEKKTGVGTGNPWRAQRWVSGAITWWFGVLAHVLWAGVYHAIKEIADSVRNHIYFEERAELRATWYNEEGDDAHLFPDHKRSRFWSLMHSLGDAVLSTRPGRWIGRMLGIQP